MGDCIIYLFTYFMTDPPTDWLTREESAVIGMQSDLMAGWPINWLIDWLMVGWLIDCGELFSDTEIISLFQKK